MSTSPSFPVFPHDRLDAYNVAVELCVAVRQLVAKLPRGHAPLADQLVRASLSTALNTAEGADSAGAGEKRQKFSIARTEAGECAAAAQIVVALGLAAAADAAPVRELAGRVAAMLTKLIRRFGGATP